LVDVLIITALPMEYDAARDVAMRLSEGAPWTEQDANTPTPYLLGAHRLASGRTLSVALARPTRMGGPATMPIMAALVERLKPHCLAMSGVCAGNPADVALGDVIIGEMVYYCDEGKRTADGFEGDHRQVPLHDTLLRAAQELRPDDLPSFGAPAGEEAKIWLLERLHAGDQPRRHPARSRYFPDAEWSERVRAIEDEGLIRRSGLTLDLTQQGRTFIEEVIFYDVAGPSRLPFEIKVGPMTSGNVVVKDGVTWDQLKRWGVRSALGLEMEAAAVGGTAQRLRVPVWFVAKGVMDHADPRKDDRYKPFAARASAEVLFKLLPKAFELVPERPAAGEPKPPPQLAEEPIVFHIGRNGVPDDASDELEVHCAETIRALRGNPDRPVEVMLTELIETDRAIADINAKPQPTLRDRQARQCLLDQRERLEARHRVLQMGLRLLLGDEAIREAWYEDSLAHLSAQAVSCFAEGVFRDFINRNGFPLVAFPAARTILSAHFELQAEDELHFLRTIGIGYPLHPDFFDGLKVRDLPMLSRVKYAIPAAVVSICQFCRQRDDADVALRELGQAGLLNVMSWELRLD
jgi:nucleoside phosphorylase